MPPFVPLRDTGEMSIANSVLKGKSVIVTGASRGIGRELAIAFGKRGANVCVVAKSAVDTPELPGTIYSVSDEIEALGTGAKVGSIPWP